MVMNMYAALLAGPNIQIMGLIHISSPIYL